MSLDNMKAIAVLQQKANAGDTTAQNKLKDINRYIFSQTQDKALNGDITAMGILGSMYLEGSFGVEPNSHLAFKWMKKSADAGLPIAMDTLGMMYNNAIGTPRDDSKAFEYMEKAALKGWKTSYLNLGLMYYNGEGIERSLDNAIKCFSKGAQAGDSKAQLIMNSLEKYKKRYEEETNDPRIKEKREHAKLLNLANFGYPDKQYELALKLLPFTIMDKNYYNQVHTLLAQAAAKNHVKAKQLLKGMDNDDGSRTYLKKFLAQNPT